MSKSELQEACELNEITISSEHLYVDYSEDEKFPRDKWACTISYKDKSATFEFFSGCGDRVCAMGVKKEGPRKYVSRGGDVVFGEKQAIEKGFLVLKKEKGKIVGPDVADVLRCLLDSTRACMTTFDEWCSDYGSNNDSLQALNTYLACQREGAKIRKVLGYALTEELVQKEH